jgi:hypothetical protein
MNKLEIGVQATAVVADAAIPNPGTKATNNSLVYNGSAWVAQNIVNAQIDATAAISVSKLSGPYTTYTPTLTATGGGTPLLGNATVIARYLQIGKLVHAYGSLTLGSTTSFGTGTLELALPVTAAQSVLWGHGEAVDLSTGNRALLTVEAITDLAHMQFVGQTTFNGAGTGVSGTTPFPWSWATGDSLSWNTTYEAA